MSNLYRAIYKCNLKKTFPDFSTRYENVASCLTGIQTANLYCSHGRRFFLVETTNAQSGYIRLKHFTISPIRNFSDASVWSESAYEEKADEILEGLSDKLELFLDQLEDKSYDITYNNGVITLALGDHGTYVINKQTPNKQIWLSSPISGPKRYDYMDGKWIYKHTGESLLHLLKSELESTFNVSVDLLE